MQTFSDEFVIDQPRQVVFERLRHFEHYPRFMDSADEVQRLQGDRLRWKVKVGPVSREYESTIVAEDPDRIAWRTDEEDFREAGEIRLVDAGEARTTVRLDASYDLDSAAFRFADAVGYLQRKARDDLRSLQRYLEEG